MTENTTSPKTNVNSLNSSRLDSPRQKVKLRLWVMDYTPS